jgi:hypothetical protein
MKAAAQLCVERGWVEETGELQGKGKSAKQMFRITAAGVEFAISRSESARLLSDLLDVADAQRSTLDGIRSQLDANSKRLDAQGTLLQRLQDRVVPPDLSALLSAGRGSKSQGESIARPAPQTQASAGWLNSAVDFARQYRQKNPLGSCPLPELFRGVAEPAGMSIGQFHDGVRQLVRERRLRLHPWTGPMYQLKDEQYALMLGQEIKFYADAD